MEQLYVSFGNLPALFFPFVKVILYIMASEELVRALDYILNRCNEQDIEAIAAAVVRRRRDITMFGSMPMAPDPRRLAEEISSQLNIEGSIESLKKSVRDYAVRIIKQQAPELTDRQIAELTRTWIPGEASSPKETRPPKKSTAGGRKYSHSPATDQSFSLETTIPRSLLVSMINQFVSFSLGRMEEEEDRALRREMGPWPDKYWKAFPQVICLIIKDYLKGEMDETDFNTRIGLALQMD